LLKKNCGAGAEPIGKIRNEKLYVIVARNTFRNKKNKINILPILEIKMSKKYTPLRCEIDFQIKINKKY
jgi:hypothetical protein